MNPFDELFAAIANRPAMYVGHRSLRAISTYLDGYTHALTDNGLADPLHGWRMWVYHRYQVWHPAWHWTRVLLHVYGSDADAIAALVPLYGDFADQRAGIDVDALEAELRQQLAAKYGRDWYEPESTHTSVDG